MLWELTSLGSTPYPNLQNQEISCFITSGKRLTKPDFCNEQIYSVMLKCWNHNAQQRPSFIEIENFLNEIN